MLYNMPLMFYSEIDDYGKPKKNGDTKKNLDDYFKLFDGRILMIKEKKL